MGAADSRSKNFMNPSQPPDLANLYAPPQALDNYRAFQPGQLWRAGNLVVATKQTEFPPICIKTGAPATVFKTRKLSWHSPWAYLGLLGGLLPFVVIALVTTKRGDIIIGLSKEAAVKRVRWIAMGWIGFVAGLAALIGIGSNMETKGSGFALTAGIIALLTWIIIASRKARLCLPKRITDTHLFIQGVHPAVMAGFPEWPGPLK